MALGVAFGRHILLGPRTSSWHPCPGVKHFRHLSLTSQRCWKRRGLGRQKRLPNTCLRPEPSGTQGVALASSENELPNDEGNFPAVLTGSVIWV